MPATRTTKMKSASSTTRKGTAATIAPDKPTGRKAAAHPRSMAAANSTGAMLRDIRTRGEELTADITDLLRRLC